MSAKRPRMAYLGYPIRLDLSAANAVQTFHTCAELRKLDPSIEVIVPRLPFQKSEFKKIGATHMLRIPFNKVTRLVKGTIWSYIERTAFAFETALYFVFRRLLGRPSPDSIYIRDVICAFWFAVVFGPLLGIDVIYEAHDLEAFHPSKSKGRITRRVLGIIDRETIRRSAAIVSLTRTFADYLAETGLRTDHVFVIPDAFDLAVYRPMNSVECRAELKLPADFFIVTYSGLTFAYRRLDILIEAFAGLLKMKPDALLVLVGGRDFEIDELKEQARGCGIPDGKMLMAGRHGAETVVRYLNASDALVIPDTVTDITASPLKMFEYMAVGKPVVLPDMLALREILDDTSAFFFERGNAGSLRRSLEQIANGAGENRAAVALERAQQYTYSERARAILSVVNATTRK